MGNRHLLTGLLLAIAVITCLVGLPQGAYASANSLTLHFAHGDEAVAGVTAKAYLVGQRDPDTGDFVLDESLSRSGVTLPTGDAAKVASRWDAAAKKAAGFVAGQSVEPKASGRSDGDGDVTFPGLSDGLYLVTSDPREIGGTTYDFSPYLVALPDVTKSGESARAVTSAPKSSVEQPPAPTPPEPVPDTPTPTPKELAKTGDSLLPMIAAGALALVGLVMIALAWKMRNGCDEAKRDDDASN